MINYLMLLVGLLIISACSTNKSGRTASEINRECIVEMEAARTAIRLRNNGKPQQELASSLPPLSKDSEHLLLALHQIVDESYRYAQLNEVIYSNYRFQRCIRYFTNKAYPRDLKLVYSPLMACQQQYGAKASRESTDCVSTVFNNSTPGK